MPAIIVSPVPPVGRLYLDTVNFQVFTSDGRELGHWLMGPPALLDDDTEEAIRHGNIAGSLTQLALFAHVERDWPVQDSAFEVRAVYAMQYDGRAAWWTEGKMIYEAVSPSFDLPNPAWRMAPLCR